MPVIQSNYRVRGLHRSGFYQTIASSLFRKIETEHYTRQQLELDDGDFLELDWSYAQGAAQESDQAEGATQKALVIVSHGLEGNSRRPYTSGIAHAANRKGMDCLAWNFRSCGGQMNRLLNFYHSGSSDDLQRVVEHAASIGYQEIYLVGFSMGGNITLLHAGREAQQLHPAVKGTVAFSTPIDLAACVAELSKAKNKLFMKRFLRDLRVKLADKAERFPQHVDLQGYEKITDFQQYDQRYTAPIHGFLDAEDYWRKSSSMFYLDKIKIPTLLVNALDDSFLADSCFPYEQAAHQDNFYFEATGYGGHVGFISKNKDGSYFSDNRAMQFIEWIQTAADNRQFSVK